MRLPEASFFGFRPECRNILFHLGYLRCSPGVMSRAEIIRTLSLRMVNAIKRRRSASVLPSTKHLVSDNEWDLSRCTTRGRLKNASSHSAWETSCESQFFDALPSSQVNPVHARNLSLGFTMVNVYHHHIHASSHACPLDAAGGACMMTGLVQEGAST